MCAFVASKLSCILKVVWPVRGRGFDSKTIITWLNYSDYSEVILMSHENKLKFCLNSLISISSMINIQLALCRCEFWWIWQKWWSPWLQVCAMVNKRKGRKRQLKGAVSWAMCLKWCCKHIPFVAGRYSYMVKHYCTM